MQVNLEGDLAELARGELAALGQAPKPGESSRETIRSLLTILQRVPPQIPWTVVESKELKRRRKELSPSLRRGLDGLVKAAKAGKSLRPWMSKTVRRSDFQDAAMHTWRITHFHLGEAVQADGFVERTGHWALAVFEAERGTLYVLDVVPHNSKEMARQDVLALIERNWPDLIEARELKGFQTNDNYTDEEVHEFRKSSVNIVTTTPGGKATTGLGGGISTAGTSIDVQLQLNQISRHLKAIEQQLHAKADEVEKIIGRPAGEPGEGLQVQMVEYGPRLRLKELATDKIIVDEALD